ncbi:MAG TPA: hypothetical protein VKF42_09860 [Chitinivibrionales bacterium]|nr:hypothetical protein [Chitinivibrionales bacterium]
MQITKEGLQSDLSNLKMAIDRKTSERDQLIGRMQAVQAILDAMDKPDPKKKQEGKENQ